jgi:hypothetical protein
MYQQYIPDSSLKTLQQAVQVLKQLYERQITAISNERNYKLLETEKENATWQERDERNQRMREALSSTEPKLAELHKMADIVGTLETLVSASVKYYNDDAGETCPVCTKVFEKKVETTEQF